ncbi:MAG: alpha/beta hydrolase [Gammaproteobacteria bacterium]|nr:alpha/beta hydrolase [Gammaproteobacteria bacterium]
MSLTERRFRGRDVELCYFERGPEQSSRQVLLLHATGFHARCWDRVIGLLPDDVHVIAVDLRGHGRSEKKPPYVWSSFAQDISELIAARGLSGLTAAGHSMGGHCLVQVAHRQPAAFRSLILADPVIMAPELYAEGSRHGFARVEDHPVSRRRALWVNWEEMFDRFKSRHPYSLWRQEVLEDYCRYGVLPQSDDTWILACPPQVEASIYMANTSSDVHRLIPEIRLPVTVLRARERDFSKVPEPGAPMDFATSPTWSGLANAFPRGRDVYLPELTHFIPMQTPELVARYLLAELDAVD